MSDYDPQKCVKHTVDVPVGYVRHGLAVCGCVGCTNRLPGGWLLNWEDTALYHKREASCEWCARQAKEPQ